MRWAHREILFPKPAFRAFYKKLETIDEMSAPREFLRSVNLVQFVPISEIEAGMELLLTSKDRIPSLFEQLRELLLGKIHQAPVIELTQRLGQKPLQPELAHYDKLIPSNERKCQS